MRSSWSRFGTLTTQNTGEMLDWVGGSFDPSAFAPEDVEFDDPKERWRNAFGRGNEPV